MLQYSHLTTLHSTDSKLEVMKDIIDYCRLCLYHTSKPPVNATQVNHPQASTDQTPIYATSIPRTHTCQSRRHSQQVYYTGPTAGPHLCVDAGPVAISE
jgi:hypothetical protein